VQGAMYAEIQCAETTRGKRKTKTHEQKYQWHHGLWDSEDCPVIMFSGHQQWTDMQTKDLSGWSSLPKQDCAAQEWTSVGSGWQEHL